MHVHTCMHAHIHTHLHTCIHRHICACMYAHACTHTVTCTHIHTAILSTKSKLPLGPQTHVWYTDTRIIGLCIARKSTTGPVHTGHGSPFANKFAHKSFAAACKLCEHSHWLQCVPQFVYMLLQCAPHPVWTGPWGILLSGSKSGPKLQLFQPLAAILVNKGCRGQKSL